LKKPVKNNKYYIASLFKNMIKKKYILIPDYVISRTDGDLHYVDAMQLARLYNVPLSECIVVKGRPRDWLGRNLPDLPVLKPRWITY
jgi:hypothetical protein